MLVHVQDCAKKFDVDESDLKKAKEEENIDGVDPCLIGCVFKNIKLVSGNVDIQSVLVVSTPD